MLVDELCCDFKVRAGNMASYISRRGIFLQCVGVWHALQLMNICIAKFQQEIWSLKLVYLQFSASIICLDVITANSIKL